MDAPPRWRLIECDPPQRLPDEVVLEESSEPEIDEEIAQRPVFVYESHLAEQIRKRREGQAPGGHPQAPSDERDLSRESFAADSLVGPSLSLCPCARCRNTGFPSGESGDDDDTSYCYAQIAATC